MRRAILPPKVWISLVIVSGLAVVILANTHLVYVAIQSRPDCIGHLKLKGQQPDIYRAAKSAC